MTSETVDSPIATRPVARFSPRPVDGRVFAARADAADQRRAVVFEKHQMFWTTIGHIVAHVRAGNLVSDATLGQAVDAARALGRDAADVVEAARDSFQFPSERQRFEPIARRLRTRETTLLDSGILKHP